MRRAPLWSAAGHAIHMSATMLTIAPPLACIACGSSARAPSGSRRSGCCARPSRSPGLDEREGAGNCPPALTRPSMRPCAASTAAATSRRRSSSRMSRTCVDVSSPAAPDLGLHGFELVGFASRAATNPPSGEFWCACSARRPSPAGDDDDLAAEQARREDGAVVRSRQVAASWMKARSRRRSRRCRATRACGVEPLNRTSSARRRSAGAPAPPVRAACRRRRAPERRHPGHPRSRAAGARCRRAGAR